MAHLSVTLYPAVLIKKLILLLYDLFYDSFLHQSLKKLININLRKEL